MLIIYNGANLGDATGAMASLVFWSGSFKKSRNQSLVVLSGTRLFLPSFGANVNIVTELFFKMKPFLLFFSTVGAVTK